MRNYKYRDTEYKVYVACCIANINTLNLLNRRGLSYKTEHMVHSSTLTEFIIMYQGELDTAGPEK